MKIEIHNPDGIKFHLDKNVPVFTHEARFPDGIKAFGNVKDGYIEIKKPESHLQLVIDSIGQKRLRAFPSFRILKKEGDLITDAILTSVSLAPFNGEESAIIRTPEAGEPTYVIMSGFVGNSMNFWRKGKAGYTTDFDKVNQFTLEDAQQLARKNERIFPYDELNSRTYRSVNPEIPEDNVWDFEVKKEN